MPPLRQGGSKKLDSLPSGLDEPLSSRDLNRDMSRTATPGPDFRPPSSALMAAAGDMTQRSDRQLESLFQKYYGGLSDHVLKVEKGTTEAIQRMEKQIAEGNTKVQTVLDMQHNLAEYMAKSNPKDEIQEIRNANSAHDAKLTNIADLQRWMVEISRDTLSKLRDLTDKAERNATDLMDVLSRTSQAEPDGFLGSTSQDLDSMRTEMYRSRVQSNFDCKTILGEITRIQKSLQVEYVAVQLSSAFPGATHSLYSSDMSALLDDASMNLEAIRLRDVGVETEQAVEEGWAQTDPVNFEGKRKEKQKVVKPKRAKDAVARAKRASQTMAFSEADDLRQRAREESMKPPYNVFDRYHETGLAQRIAKSNLFDRISLFVTCVNALWIAIDADLNKAETIADAEPTFLIAENFFCLFFLFEIVIRFLAFENKFNCLRDAWFVFDAMLVFLMVIETWVVYIIIYATGADSLKGVGAFRLFRFARLSRITKIARLSRVVRLVRLVRSVPELLIVVKAMKFAARSVLVFCLVWCLIIYAFAILLRQLTEDEDIGQKYFPNMPKSMNTLLLRGIFPGSADVLHDITADHVYLWPIMILFAGLVTLMTMYMLVGVLVDTVKIVAGAEKEALVVGLLACQLREEFQKMGYQPETMLVNQYEFQNLIMHPSVVQIMNDVSVDVAVLADMLELVCEDISKRVNSLLSFSEIVDIILSMRGTNSATVKDCKEMIRLNKQVLKRTAEELHAYMAAEFATMQEQIAYANVDVDDLDEDMFEDMSSASKSSF